MVAKRPDRGQLRVIKGGSDTQSKKGDGESRPHNLLLILLALFLLSHILLGWLWGAFNRSAAKFVLATAHSVEISLLNNGVITFEEELIFAPQAGFVQYHVNAGERVPLGKELAVISSLPPEKGADAAAEEGEGSDYLQRFRSWLLDDRDETFCPAANISFAQNLQWEIVSPRPGLVSMRIDGWEMFGPNSSFVYLDEHEYGEKEPHIRDLGCGEQVLRFSPVLRIINNYRWYFSAVLPAEPGKKIAQEDRIKLRFDFAPDQPVWAAKVEARQRDDGKIEITWSIDQAAGDFYNHRWCTAEIVYESLEGVLVPKHTVIDADGEKGVFVVEKGLITWREVVLLAEKDDGLLVDNLVPYERIIARPGRVKEGQRLLW